MTTSTDRQTFRETVALVAAKAKAILPEAVNGRVEAATRLVLLHDVTPQADGSIVVGSSTDPLKTYRLTGGACECQDFTRGQAPEGWCQHRIAAGIQKRVEEVLTAQTPALLPQTPAVEPEPAPTPAPVGALPEAPVSITLRATLHGHEVLVTLRGHDFASVQAQVEQASAWLKSQAPAGPPEEAHDQQWCAIHGVQLRLNRGKDGKPDWFSHKTPEGTWCKGQRRRA